MIQWRPPRSGVCSVRDPMYSPHRDIAYIGQYLIHEAMCALDDQCEEEWFKRWMQDYNVTVDDLAAGASALAEAMQHMDKPVLQVLEECKFTKLNSPAQAAIFIKLGQAFIAAIHVGVRDIHSADSGPPPAVADLADTVSEVLKELKIKQSERLI